MSLFFFFLQEEKEKKEGRRKVFFQGQGRARPPPLRKKKTEKKRRLIFKLRCFFVLNTARSLLLLILISRSKLVPDFVLTLHFLHLVATSLYSRSLPRNWLWWMLQAASASLMISLGIWSCRWRELKPINFGGSGGGAVNDHVGEGKIEATGGRLLGEERGRETGLGGEYEMVVGINKGGGGS